MHIFVFREKFQFYFEYFSFKDMQLVKNKPIQIDSSKIIFKKGVGKSVGKSVGIR